MSVKRTLMFLSYLSLLGCAGVTPVGNSKYEALSESENVQVFANEKSAPSTFEILAIINYNNPGKFQVLTLDDAIPSLVKKARLSGANGVIIDEYYPIKSGFISTGIGVKARAIRFRR